MSRKTYFSRQKGRKKIVVKIVLFHIKKDVFLYVFLDVKEYVFSDVFFYANHFIFNFYFLSINYKNIVKCDKHATKNCMIR